MRLLAAALLFSATSCPSYDYEEEVFLAIDGSGTIRVSGSKELLRAYHELPAPITTATVRRYFSAPGLEVETVRATSREGEEFLHVQGSFDDWNALCAHPAFEDRRCELVRTSDGFELFLEVPPPRTETSSDRGELETGPLAAFRFHFPSSVSFHNSKTGLERGNIVSWERRALAVEQGSLPIEAHFGARSILATTFTILVAAVAIVVVGIAVSLALIVRKGRRQLAEERR